MKTPRAGLALLVVLGILGVLAILAVSFVTLAQLERKASRQRLYATKAALLARSGIEDALARLSAGQDASSLQNAYQGEDWNADALLDGPEPAAEVFGAGTLNTVDCPLRLALRPSFFAADSLQQPLLDSLRRGFSGRLAADLAPLGNQYVLKVEDESGKINVNGGFLGADDRDGDGIPDHRDPFVAETRPVTSGLPADASGPGRGWNGQLARILDVLGAQPEVGVANLGTLALQNRPRGGYASVDQLQAAVGTARDLSPWITVSSWIDRKVVHPNAYATQLAQLGSSDIKKRRLPLAPEEEGRPPVNLNAASRAVLVAILQDLSAVSTAHVQEHLGGSGGPGDPGGGETGERMKPRELFPPPAETVTIAAQAPQWLEHPGDPVTIAAGLPTPLLDPGMLPIYVELFGDPGNPADPGDVRMDLYRITPTMASDIADAILRFRTGVDPFPSWATDPSRPVPVPGLFDSWEHFSQFCDGLVPTLVSGMNAMVMSGSGNGGNREGGNRCGADLLKANFNPNTGLSKDLPDQLMFRWVDKSDLTIWSTEGSLYPTGSFRLSAVGRVLAENGSLLAEQTRGATVEAFSLLRQTSQKDFVGTRTSLKDYLSLGTNPLLPTEGSSTTSLAFWGPLLPPAGSGLAVTTCPCAPMAIPMGKAADFDGFLALATVELANLNPTAGTLMFLQHFDDDWDAEAVPGNPAGENKRQSFPLADSLLQGNAWESSWPDPSVEPGTLHPDGAYVQVRRSPAYKATGNFPVSYPPGNTSNHAVFSYWVKAFSSAKARYRIDFSCIRDLGSKATQSLVIGREADNWGIAWENWIEAVSPVSDPGCLERQYHTQEGDAGMVLLPGLRWHLITALLDSDEPVLGNDLHLWVKSVRGPWTDDPAGGSYSTPNTSTTDQDVLSGGTLMALGGQLTDTQVGGFLANEVLDEFAICDFTDNGPTALLNAANWANARYREGRYYKAGDGAFLSDLLRTPVPGRLLRADWTASLPRDPRMELTLDYGGAYPAGVPPMGQKRLVDPLLADQPSGAPRAWLELDLLAPGGTLSGPALQPLAQGAVLNRFLSSFRYRVRFRTDLASPGNDPLLETPFFDDITFAWQALSGPRITAWQ